MQKVTAVISNATLGRDPEIRFTPKGTTKMEFSVAVNHRNGVEKGSNEDITDWYRIEVWGKQADNLTTLLERGSLRKGARVDVVGTLTHRPYKGRDGSEKFSFEVNAHDVILVSPPKGYEAEGQGNPPMPGAGWQPPAADTSLNDVPF